MLYPMTLIEKHKTMTNVALSGYIISKVPHCSNAIDSVREQNDKPLEAIADEFAAHPDFAEARADSFLWDTALNYKQ